MKAYPGSVASKAPHCSVISRSNTMRSLVLVLVASALLAGAAKGDELTVTGTYSGEINGVDLAGVGAGYLDTTGTGPNHHDVEFSSIPDDFHPFALGISIITWKCQCASLAIGDAQNLYDLSGGNYTVERTFTWPDYPDSVLDVSGTVSTVGSEMHGDVSIVGAYDGPLDLVGVLDYTSSWSQLTPTSIQEHVVSTIERSNGETLTVQFDTAYGDLSQQLVADQTGNVYADTLTWDPSEGFWSLDWHGVQTIVPEPASLSVLGLGSLALFSRRRAIR